MEATRPFLTEMIYKAKMNLLIEEGMRINNEINTFLTKKGRYRILMMNRKTRNSCVFKLNYDKIIQYK